MKNWKAPLAVVIAILAAAMGTVYFAKDTSAVAFKSVGRDSILGTLTFLFIVAVFVERAVEVIVSTLRDMGAAALEHAAGAAQDRIDAQSAVTPGAVPYLDPLHAAQKRLVEYRSETKEIAMCTSFVLGIFVSLAGVRALAAIMNTVPDGNAVFNVADVIITGAILAGGSDAIHQMMNVIMNFFSAAADTAKGGSGANASREN